MLADKKITTIEGLSETGEHPLQKAWVENNVPQCGYCQAGQIMNAASFLQQNPTPSAEEIGFPGLGFIGLPLVTTERYLTILS